MKNQFNLDALLAMSKKGGAEGLLSSLNKEDADAIRKVLSNKAETDRLLKSDQAQKIMQMLNKDGGKHG